MSKLILLKILLKMLLHMSYNCTRQKLMACHEWVNLGLPEDNRSVWYSQPEHGHIPYIDDFFGVTCTYVHIWTVNSTLVTLRKVLERKKNDGY